ncbi:hypothetical protein HMF8227_02950 [Saliniradius amylolyticus]|uniref:DUF2750 domain-containing protein n=1 Tax=Saliniradius amylolyticus TaxID=2183582 RepID=A0A2S2E6X3_9ALTE|nr:DUF2750 domain-containing protein [Saliniradius amylolyticus]AWL13398.1 hypothetical protein HMF8227_02950 [Saliniradius amylolyticus]
MTQLSQMQKYQWESQPAHKRAEFFHQKSRQAQQVWTIVDDHGAMLLVTEDEDCIPVWPDEAFVKDWINDDWQHCRPYAISLQDWYDKWLPGLEEDGVSVVVFPVTHESGLIFEPWELNQAAA